MIDSPPSHRASRFLLALLLIVAFPAAVYGLLMAGVDTWLVDGAEALIKEARTSWGF